MHLLFSKVKEMHDDERKNHEVYRDLNVTKDSLDWSRFNSIVIWFSSKVKFIVSEDTEGVGHDMLYQECVHHVLSHIVYRCSSKNFVWGIWLSLVSEIHCPDLVKNINQNQARNLHLQNRLCVINDTRVLHQVKRVGLLFPLFIKVGLDYVSYQTSL